VTADIERRSSMILSGLQSPATAAVAAAAAAVRAATAMMKAKEVLDYSRELLNVTFFNGIMVPH